MGQSFSQEYREQLLSDLTPSFVSPAEKHHNHALAQLDRWEMNLKYIKAAFPDPKHQEILRNRTKVTAENRTVAFLSWENPLGKAGGVFPVSDMLPEALKSSGEQVLRISPLHTGLKGYLPALRDLHEIGSSHTTRKADGMPGDRYEKIAEVFVPFNSSQVPCSVIKLTTSDGREWTLFSAPTFFEADGGKNRTDPYFYTDEGGVDLVRPSLERDAYFAAKAVPYILRELGKNQNVILHAQDWQFSGIALSTLDALVDGVLESAGTTVTLHNVYDRTAIGNSLAAITLRTADRLWPACSEHERARDTFLSRFLPLFTGPVAAVSHPFSLDLRTDPQQSMNMGNHLQGVFAETDIVGVGHGPFVDTKALVFSDEAIQKAEAGDLLPIYREKARLRAELIQVLREISEENRVGWIDLQGEDIVAGEKGVKFGGVTGTPIFLMGGRLEPNQKGFDVLAHAIKQIPPGTAKFIFSPMNSDEKNQPFMDFLCKLAQDRPGEVMVLPHGLPRDQYMRLQGGASFVVYPSLFEPFGAVTESFVNGCPVVIRETGGLQSQVVDWTRDRGHATGFMGLESWHPDSVHTTAKEWQIISWAKDPLERKRSEMYQLMCGAVASAVEKAANIYRNQEEYAHMLLNVANTVKNLSWNGPVELYSKIYTLTGNSWESVISD